MISFCKDVGSPLDIYLKGCKKTQIVSLYMKTVFTSELSVGNVVLSGRCLIYVSIWSFKSTVAGTVLDMTVLLYFYFAQNSLSYSNI